MKTKLMAPAVAFLLTVLMALMIAPAIAGRASSGSPWLGIWTQKIDADMKEAFDLDRADGVVVVDVMADSPADKAGLARKDIILSVNGQKVTTPTELTDDIADLSPGDTVTLVLMHDGKERNAVIEIGKRPGWGKHSDLVLTPDAPALNQYYKSFFGPSSYIGVSIIDLTDQLAKYFAVPGDEGILISEVEKDSPAQKAGLSAGDIIVSADGEAVAHAADLQEIIGDKEAGEKVTIGYYRRGAKAEIAVEVEDNPQASSWHSQGLMGNYFGILPPTPPVPPVPPVPPLPGRYFDSQKDYDRQMEELREEKRDYDESMRKLQEELKQMRLELDDVKSKVE